MKSHSLSADSSRTLLSLYTATLPAVPLCVSLEKVLRWQRKVETCCGVRGDRPRLLAGSPSWRSRVENSPQAQREHTRTGEHTDTGHSPHASGEKRSPLWSWTLRATGHAWLLDTYSVTFSCRTRRSPPRRDRASRTRATRRRSSCRGAAWSPRRSPPWVPCHTRPRGGASRPP